MNRPVKAARTAHLALTKFTDVQPDEDVLIITDESGVEENGAIVDALFSIATQMDANPTSIVIEDADPGASQEHLPEAAKAAMETTDVLIGVTLTTHASVTHHPFPDGLREDGKLRSLVMAKRDYETLTHRFTLEPDYDRILAISDAFAEACAEGEEVHLSSDNGMDVTMRIDELGAPHGGGDFATEPGDFTVISWGEHGQAPNGGSAEGTFVIDGPVQEYGWPDAPLELDVEAGRITEIRGEGQIARELRRLIDEHENADNIAEIALGTNPIRTDLEDPNVFKNTLGTAHTAMGAGAAYGQDVESDVHLDLMMAEPTVAVDGHILIEGGDLAIDI